jgi:hypothetical protein
MNLASSSGSLTFTARRKTKTKVFCAAAMLLFHVLQKKLPWRNLYIYRRSTRAQHFRIVHRLHHTRSLTTSLPGPEGVEPDFHIAHTYSWHGDSSPWKLPFTSNYFYILLKTKPIHKLYGLNGELVNVKAGDTNSSQFATEQQTSLPNTARRQKMRKTTLEWSAIALFSVECTAAGGQLRYCPVGARQSVQLPAINQLTVSATLRTLPVGRSPSHAQEMWLWNADYYN